MKQYFRLGSSIARTFAVLAISMALTFSVGAKLALASCVPPQPSRGYINGTYQAGAVGNPSAYPSGIEAYEFEYDPYYSARNGVGTSYTLMLQGGHGWAQFGWIKHKVGSSIVRNIYSEHVDGSGGNDWTFYTPKPVGSFTNYEITFDATADHFHYFVNGVEYANEGANWIPSTYQIIGETQDTGDQMPGGYVDHAVFTSVYITQHGIAGWHYPVGDVLHHYSTSGVSKTGSNVYNTWDVACAS